MKIIAIINLMVILQIANAQDCVFREDAVEGMFKEMVERTNPKSYVWNDSSKSTRLLLNDGGLIDIQFWSCNTIGLDAKSFFSIDVMDDNNSKFWVEKFLDFGELILNPDDFMTFKSQIINQRWAVSDKIKPNSRNIALLEHESYSLFDAEIERGRDFIIFKISWSKY